MDSLKLKEALVRERELQQQLEEANHRAEKEKEEAEKRIKAAEEKSGEVPQGKAKLYKVLVSYLNKMNGMFGSCDVSIGGTCTDDIHSIIQSISMCIA